MSPGVVEKYIIFIIERLGHKPINALFALTWASFIKSSFVSGVSSDAPDKPKRKAY